MTDQTTRDGYFAGAYALLSREGYAGLKLRPLCASIGVTTGGFYHWFTSWRAFTDALLADWSEHRTRRVTHLARSVADPARRLEVLADSTLRLDQRTEAAIRTWGQVEPRIGAVVAGVDAERYAVVLETMQALVGAGEAERYAQWGYGVLLGYEQLAGLMPAPDVRWALDQVLTQARARAAR